MKYIVLVLLISFNVHGAQINLDCFDENNNKVASIYTPTFVYSNFQLKVDLNLEAGIVSMDAPFNPSMEIPGVYFATSGDITAVGMSEISPFSPGANMSLSILDRGLLVESLSCRTTINNPAFPR